MPLWGVLSTQAAGERQGNRLCDYCSALNSCAYEPENATLSYDLA
jgi:hypothetical protein